MCWNQEVSLNTFLFSSFVLGLIIYNNAYTQYKIHELNNIWVYVFFACYISMQLIEFFIWRNINNKYYNRLFSTIACCILLFQPIASLMLLSDIKIRNLLLGLYILLAGPYTIYNFSIKNIHSIKSENGHLRWIFFQAQPIFWIIWIFFFLFSFLYNRAWSGFFFITITLSFCVVMPSCLFIIANINIFLPV